MFVKKMRVEKLEKHQERVSERTAGLCLTEGKPSSAVGMCSRYTNCRNIQVVFHPAGSKLQSSNSSLAAQAKRRLSVFQVLS